jgi:drug/metabolite transporter (DMT)-like permease
MAGDSPRLVLAVWWLTCLLWSTVWLAIKVGVGDVPPATFASVRLVIALAVLLPIMAARGVPLPRARRDWRVIGVTGVLLLGLN